MRRHCPFPPVYHKPGSPHGASSARIIILYYSNNNFPQACVDTEAGQDVGARAACRRGNGLLAREVIVVKGNIFGQRVALDRVVATQKVVCSL
jgi:hypothetical protein